MTHDYLTYNKIKNTIVCVEKAINVKNKLEEFIKNNEDFIEWYEIPKPKTINALRVREAQKEYEIDLDLYTILLKTNDKQYRSFSCFLLNHFKEDDCHNAYTPILDSYEYLKHSVIDKIDLNGFNEIDIYIKSNYMREHNFENFIITINENGVFDICDNRIDYDLYMLDERDIKNIQNELRRTTLGE